MEARFADAIISNLLAETKLSIPDRGFALELFYGVLRNLTLLDFWIGCLRTSQVDVDLRDLLRLGLYQLFLLKTAEHAAVYETVELASKRQRPTIVNVSRLISETRSKIRFSHAACSHATAVSLAVFAMIRAHSAILWG